uniref:Uncharacterized protein n=1 Tax=Aegilops tauschii subsp. strangulata TaxID=200361 RepID=A0A452XV82_AEGTS
WLRCTLCVIILWEINTNISKICVCSVERSTMLMLPSFPVQVMLELPMVRWEDVGGQARIKKQLIEAIQLPQKCPDAFERLGIRPPRGLLM